MIFQTMTSKSYSELASLATFEERFEYLKLNGQVGQDTFGFNRYLNQDFYKSKEWKQVRSFVIARDNGCEMGLQGYPIKGQIYVHHINPISDEDICNSTDLLLNPENLVCVSLELHNAIHYGDNSIVKKNNIVERGPNDTCPWRK